MDFEDFRIGAHYSNINFDDGGIESSQLLFNIDIPFYFDWYNFNHLEHNYKLEEFGYNTPLNNLRPSKHSFATKFDNYFPLKGSKDVGKNELNLTISLVGFEYNYFINNKWFLSFEADGAYKGIKGGYMDIFGGGGYKINTSIINFRTKFLIGAGGGGSIETDGGMLFLPKIEIEKEIFSNLLLNLNSGYLFSTQNKLNAITLGASVKYKLHLGTTKNRHSIGFHSVKLKGFSLDFSNQTYINAQKNSTRNIDLGQLSTQLNFHMSQHSYLAGQATFAYIGNAGAYAEGLVGYGITYQINKNTRYFTQLLAGTAGGGGVATDQGFLIKPSIGINHQLYNQYGIQIKTGYAFAPLGKLSCPFIGLGLNYQISLPLLK